MGILSVMTRSLKEMLWPRRFLPFFLLDFAVFIAAYPVIASMLDTLILPVIAGTPLTASRLSLVLPNAAVLLAEVAIFALATVWFNAALVYDVKTSRGFGRGLRETGGMYWQMLAFFVVFGLLSTLLGYTGSASLVLGFVLSWVFAFTVQSIVVERRSFDRAMLRSFRIVKAKPLETLAFYLVLNFVRVAVMVVLVMFALFALSPFVIAAVPALSGGALDLETLQTAEGYRAVMSSVVSSLVSDYPLVVVAMIAASLVLSINHSLQYLATTYFFVEVSGKVREPKGKVRAVKGKARKRKK